jgi:probable HAF family extracellular repeat protein
VITTFLRGAIASSIALASAVARADEPFMIDLGDLPGGLRAAGATGISIDGRFVVGFSHVGGIGDTQAFSWTFDTGMVAFIPDTMWSEAHDTGALGRVITGDYAHWHGGHNRVQEAYRWTEAGGLEPLGDLPGGDFYSVGTDISADGNVIVGPSRSGPSGWSEGFRWTRETGMVGLGYLPGGTYSHAVDISGDGRVIVGWSDGTPFHDESYYWTDETGMVGLGPTPGSGNSNMARAVSWDGSVIVGRMFHETWGEAYRWTRETGFVGLGDLPGSEDYSIATAVNADGSIVGGISLARVNNVNRQVVFIWDEQHGMRNLETVLTDLGLDLDGLEIRGVAGFSLDGRTLIVNGKRGFDNVAWLVYLGNPCPGDFNKDGVANEQDFTDFLDAFLAGHYSADLHTDATIDSRDFIAFLNAYVQDCQ